MKHNLIYWLCGVLIVFYVLVYGVLGYAVAAYAIAGLLFGGGVMLIWDWWRPAYEGIKDGGKTPEAVLAFTLVSLGVYAVHTRMVSIYKIGAGFPSWIDTHWISQFAGIELLIVFFGIILATSRQNAGKMPETGAARLAVIGFLAGLFVGLAVAFAIWGQPPQDGLKVPGRGVGMERSSTLPKLMCDTPERSQLVQAYCRRPGS